MTVHFADGFQASPRWVRIAASTAAALRDAQLGAWHVTISPVAAGSTVGPTAGPVPPHVRDAEFGLAIRVDVADMSLEASVPAGDIPLEDGDLGRMLVEYIQEAEDETASEYGPTDEDDFPDPTP